MPAGEVPAAADVQKFESQAPRSPSRCLPTCAASLPTPPIFCILRGRNIRGWLLRDLWSEVLARDTERWNLCAWRAQSGPPVMCTEKCCRAVAPEEQRSLFKNLYGGDPDIGPLIEYHAIGAK